MKKNKVKKIKPNQPPPEDLANNKRDRQPVIIESLRHGATVRAACRAADISHETFYKWCERDAKFKKQVLAAKQSSVFQVEDALFESAKIPLPGHATDRIFFLCNRSEDWHNVNKIEHSGEVSIKSLLTDKGVEE